MNQKIDIYSIDRRKRSIYSKVDVAQNEPLLNPVINRGLSALCDNDNTLYELNKLIFQQLSITDYVSGMTYNVGDLVWYRDVLRRIYLLRCIRQNNDLEPDTMNSGDVFDTKLNASGWENQNKNLNILDYYVGNLISSEAYAATYEHEHKVEYHPYGKVSLNDTSENSIYKKLLRSDLENINTLRSSVFFPDSMDRMPSTYATMTGYCRVYNNLILEYDIIFKLGSSTISKSNALFDQFQTLSANNVAFQLYAGLGKANVNYQTNKSYFFSTSDMDIFQPEDSTLSSQCALLIQLNRNDYVNTYTAKVTFPFPFADNNYMVFANSILSQTIGNDELVPSANEMTYCDKTKQSIVFLDITFPDSTKYGETGYNAQRGGLVANSFHCKVIGRKLGA